MDFAQVLQILNDLPTTFKRTSASYVQLVDAFTTALALFTQGADTTLSQLDFKQARYNWLDVFGLLFDIPRLANQSDAGYSAMIAFELLSGGGPPMQIVSWILVVYGVAVQITENTPNVGYTITFPGTVTVDQIQTILNGLGYVRPAGVPITGVFSYGAGTILDTINFFNAPEVVGAYLTGGAAPIAFSIPPTTNNAVPLLPTLFVTDPILNPNH